MFEVLNYEDSKSAISKAIEEIEVEGIVDETLLINTKSRKGNVLVEVGRQVDKTSNIPSYRTVQELKYSDPLVKMITKFNEMKEKKLAATAS